MEHTPKNDFQAPDLYIPLMGFVTFILVTGFYIGSEKRFDPSVTGYVYSKALFFWIFETVLLKAIYYFLGVCNPYFFEMLAYCGYKFVVLSIIVLSHLAFGYLASYFVMLFFGAMFVLFFYFTVRRF